MDFVRSVIWKKSEPKVFNWPKQNMIEWAKKIQIS